MIKAGSMSSYSGDSSHASSKKSKKITNKSKFFLTIPSLNLNVNNGSKRNNQQSKKKPTKNVKKSKTLNTAQCKSFINNLALKIPTIGKQTDPIRKTKTFKKLDSQASIDSDTTKKENPSKNLITNTFAFKTPEIGILNYDQSDSDKSIDTNNYLMEAVNKKIINIHTSFQIESLKSKSSSSNLHLSKGLLRAPNVKKVSKFASKRIISSNRSICNKSENQTKRTNLKPSSSSRDNPSTAKKKDNKYQNSL